MALGARKADSDNFELEIELTLRITGAKLSKMTQALAYKAIRE